MSLTPQAHTTREGTLRRTRLTADCRIPQSGESPARSTAGKATDVGASKRPAPQLTGGGIQPTGNYPGKARLIAAALRPSRRRSASNPRHHRLNLHACYLDNGCTYVDRTEIAPKAFQIWID